MAARTLAYELSHHFYAPFFSPALHLAIATRHLRPDTEYLPNNRKTRRTRVVPKEIADGRTGRRERVRRIGTERFGGLAKRMRRSEREGEKKRNQPRDTSPQKTRRATREEERLSGTPKSGMGAWVEWAMVGTGETRRPARTRVGGGDGCGPRGEKRRHCE